MPVLRGHSPQPLPRGKTMAKATFTRGPWKLYKDKLRPEYPVMVHEVQDERGNAIVKWAGFDGCDQPKGQITANARLIASAPELLSALRAARAWLEPTRFNRHTIAQIDRVLKKAAADETAKDKP